MDTTEVLNYKDAAPCTRCKGKGTIHHKGFVADSGKVYPDRDDPCHSCNGAGNFPAVDVETIGSLIQSTKGKKGFRKSWPAKMNPWRTKDITVRRAYYVWRNARFHGGVDVTMPVTAIDTSSGDPHIRFLDALADFVAKKVFKTNMAAAYRWRAALGYSNAIPAGLPSTAYPGGEVVQGEKPEFEAMELES